jgi:hypothetical protein
MIRPLSSRRISLARSQLALSLAPSLARSLALSLALSLFSPASLFLYVLSLSLPHTHSLSSLALPQPQPPHPTLPAHPHPFLPLQQLPILHYRRTQPALDAASEGGKEGGKEGRKDCQKGGRENTRLSRDSREGGMARPQQSDKGGNTRICYQTAGAAGGTDTRSLRHTCFTYT